MVTRRNSSHALSIAILPSIVAIITPTFIKPHKHGHISCNDISAMNLAWFVRPLKSYSMHSLMSASHNLKSPANGRDSDVNAENMHKLVLDFTQVNARLIQIHPEQHYLFKFSKQKCWPMSTFAWHVSCDLKMRNVSPDCAFRDTKEHSDFGIRLFVHQM